MKKDLKKHRKSKDKEKMNVVAVADQKKGPKSSKVARIDTSGTNKNGNANPNENTPRRLHQQSAPANFQISGAPLRDRTRDRDRDNQEKTQASQSDENETDDNFTFRGDARPVTSIAPTSSLHNFLIFFIFFLFISDTQRIGQHIVRK